MLGTGGGVVKALPMLGDAPFFHLNSDSIWIDGVRPNLDRLAEAFDPARDGCVAAAGAGHRPASAMPAAGTSPWRRMAGCARRTEREVVPFVYAGRGAALARACSPVRLPGEFSLTRCSTARSRRGRLHGLRLEGLWMHIGTPGRNCARPKPRIVASAA